MISCFFGTMTRDQSCSRLRVMESDFGLISKAGNKPGRAVPELSELCWMAIATDEKTAEHKDILSKILEWVLETHMFG